MIIIRMSVERGLVALLGIHDDRLSGLALGGEFSDQVGVGFLEGFSI